MTVCNTVNGERVNDANGTKSALVSNLSKMSPSIQPSELVSDNQQQSNMCQSETDTPSGSKFTERRLREHERVSKECENYDAIEVGREQKRERVRTRRVDNWQIGKETSDRENNNNNNVDVSTGNEDVNMVATSSTTRNKTGDQKIIRQVVRIIITHRVIIWVKYRPITQSVKEWMTEGVIGGKTYPEPYNFTIWPRY